MTTTKTADINATLQDRPRSSPPAWTSSGWQHLTRRERLGGDRREVDRAIADIHFQWKYAIAALEAGIQGLRINPGNIKYQDKVRAIAREAKARGVPTGIGVNAGLLEKDLLVTHATPEALVESALGEARILEDEDFFDIKISVKHSNPMVIIEAYRQLAERCDYLLHLGVTEAGPMPMGGVKSAVGTGRSSPRGSATRIRVSLTDDPVEEVKVGRGPAVWACGSAASISSPAPPADGRWMLGLTKQVNGRWSARLADPRRGDGVRRERPRRGAEADLGIAAGKGRGSSSSRVRSSTRSSRPTSSRVWWRRRRRSPPPHPWA